MKHIGMPIGMWALFAHSFRKQLTAVFGYDADMATGITRKAKPRYREIIAGLPEFEHRQLCDDRCVHPLYAGASGCGAADRVLCKSYDDKTDEMVLPQERKEEIH